MALWGMVLAGLGGCAGMMGPRGPASESAAVATPPSDPPLPRVIDAHAHFEDAEGKAVPGPSVKMYQEFAENNVVGAVVHAARQGAVPVGYQGAPVQFAVCAAAVPGRPTKEVEAGLRDGRYACMKVYLGYVPRYASDPLYTPFYKLAEKYDVPVVFHTGDTYDKMAKVKYADPLTVDEIAVTYPKVRFVLAHLGNPWLQSAAEVTYKNDNVYADASALMLGDLGKAAPESIEELVVKPIRWFFLYVENPRKILFGTDWPLVDVKSYIAAVKRAVPQKHWDDVFFMNATRVFKTLGEGRKVAISPRNPRSKPVPKAPEPSLPTDQAR